MRMNLMSLLIFIFSVSASADIEIIKKYAEKMPTEACSQNGSGLFFAMARQSAILSRDGARMAVHSASGFAYGSHVYTATPVDRCLSPYDELNVKQKAICIQPLLKRVCSVLSILQSCEKNYTLIDNLFNLAHVTNAMPQTKEGDPEIVEQLYDLAWVFAGKCYPMLTSYVAELNRRRDYGVDHMRAVEERRRRILEENMRQLDNPPVIPKLPTVQ